MRFLGRHENYGYVNALLRSRISSFLERAEYEILIDGSLESMEAYLLESKYGEAYRSELVSRQRNRLQRIEFALAVGMGRELLHMRKVAEGETADLVALLLARGDMHNIRVLLRSFLPGSQRNSQEPLWHNYGIVSPQKLALLWHAKNLQELAERSHNIHGVFGQTLGSAALSLFRGISFRHVERYCLLEYRKALFLLREACLSPNGETAEEYLRMTLDFFNLCVWLRKNHGYEKTELYAEGDYLKGGTLPPRRFLESRSILEVVRGSRWNAMVRRIDESLPNMFQQALHRHFLYWQGSFLRKNPLGIEVALGFAARQFAEWENLNSIVTGLALGYEKEHIRQRLLVFS